MTPEERAEYLIACIGTHSQKAAKPATKCITCLNQVVRILNDVRDDARNDALEEVATLFSARNYFETTNSEAAATLRALKVKPGEKQ